MINKSFSNSNIFLVTVYRLVTIFFIYTICRLGFYFFNIDNFPDIGLSNFFNILIGGLKFDISAIFYTNLLFILLSTIPFQFRYNRGYQKTLFWIFMVFNSIGILANVIDTVYYRYVFRRTTSTIFGEFANDGGHFGGIIIDFLIDYYAELLFFLACVFVLRYLYTRLNLTKPTIENEKKYYIKHSLAIPFIVFFVIAGIRGTFVIPTFPITLSNALSSCEKPEQSAIVLNTPFSIIRTIGKSDYDRKHYYKNEDELNTVFSPRVKLAGEEFKQKNVVYIILESFSKEFFGIANQDIKGYKGYTPFLDSLFAQSYTFTNAYANGTKSVEGVPAIVSSIPSGKEPYFTFHHANNNIMSTASVLREKGYQTAFFLGAPNGSMNFTQYAKNAGYEMYFGMDNYMNEGGVREDYDGYWGTWDHKFLPYTVDKISTFKEPFYASVFTVNSHNPYPIPEIYKGKLRTGPIKMCQSIHYTDSSLKLFFEKAKKQPWFENTIFVFCADHSFNGVLKEYKTSLNRFAVVIAFYDPSNPNFKKLDTETVIQQSDIMPTTLGMLGYNGEFIAFGDDAFDKTKERYAYNVYNEIYQLANDSILIQYNEKKVTALYNYKKDRYLNNNLVGKHPKIQNRMEKKLKAIIQQYNNRMLDNKLVIEKK